MHPTKFDKRLLMGLGLGLSFLFVVALLHDFGPEVHLLLHYHAADRPELIKLVRAHGAQDLIFFLLLIGLLNAVPGASNSLVCILVGLCYGPAIGLAVNWLGNVGGNVACFGLIKHLSFSKHFQPNRILTNLMHHKHPLVGLTLGYMIPIVPSVLVNYACGQLKVSRLQFLLMVAIGMLPTSVLYAFGGDAIMHGDLKRLGVIGILIVGLVALRQVLGWKRHRSAN